MFRQSRFCSLVLIGFTLFLSVELFARDITTTTQSSSEDTDAPKDDKFDFTLRMGEGGFRDSRSPIGELGGGQLALDIKPVMSPVAYSISSEYYTNSADPTHSYEISSLISLNILYMAQLFEYEKTNYFLGGGIGWLKVPNSVGAIDSKLSSNLYNLEAGIHMRAFRKIGFYAVVKYLRAQREVNNIKVINFNEGIFLLGVTYNFSF